MASNKCKKSLKHRLVRLLLGSCSTSNTTTATKFAKLSNNIPKPQEFDEETPQIHRRLERHLSFPESSCIAPQPVVSDRRRSFHCSGSLPQRSTNSDLNNAIKNDRRIIENNSVYDIGDFEGHKCPPATPSSPSRTYSIPTTYKFTTQKLSTNSCRFSTSSSFFSDSDEDDEELFSSDSSELYHSIINKNSAKFPPRNHISSLKTSTKTTTKIGSDAGLAVVKQSSNPYMDFRSSMVEMIVEKRLSSGIELERLFHSFLRLNSVRHHPVILEAFADIWNAIFGKKYPDF